MIHGYWDKDIHDACLLDGWEELFFRLVGWIKVDGTRIVD